MPTIQNADNNYTGKYFIYFTDWVKEHGPRARLGVGLGLGLGLGLVFGLELGL